MDFLEQKIGIHILVKNTNFLALFQSQFTQFSRLNASGLETKLRAQRGITFVILTIRCIMAAKTLII